jgi:small subunit ribosomal protein S18
MARNNYRGGSSKRAPKDLGRRVKKKPCAMCREGVEWVDYKDVPVLRKYMSDRGKIRSRRVTGNCAQHQRDIARAIKVARELVLLPYTQRTVTEKPGGRGGRGERGGGARGERTGGERGGPPTDAPRAGGGEARGGAANGVAAPAAPVPAAAPASEEVLAPGGPAVDAPPAPPPANGADAEAMPVADSSTDGGDAKGGADQ